MKDLSGKTRDSLLILLMHLPTAKACEPQGGGARPAGALRSRGV
ncbi:MAG TPA: hypothetical protein PLM79_12280 [Syntrophobacteraceae bacterium]|nr:hypothetical protein [Syntrophobacteraceae bacterium]